MTWGLTDKLVHVTLRQANGRTWSIGTTRANRHEQTFRHRYESYSPLKFNKMKTWIITSDICPKTVREQTHESGYIRKCNEHNIDQSL